MIKINRRILDNVTITALNKHGDPELTKSVSDMFGVGTLVDDAKIPTVSFNKSMLGLSVTNVSSTIRKLANELRPNVVSGPVVDSNGNSHEVSANILALLKAISFYNITCPLVVSHCISTIMLEIDNWLKDATYKPLVTISITDGDNLVDSNKNLMNYCSKEIFGMLREAGMDIG